MKGEYFLTCLTGIITHPEGKVIEVLKQGSLLFFFFNCSNPWIHLMFQSDSKIEPLPSTDLGSFCSWFLVTG